MSRQLRNLLKQNRILEEKIFYLPRETDWREQLISSQELSDALSCLSSQILENKQADMCVLRLLNEVDFIKGRPLPAFEKNALQVVEILFNYLREHSSFDPQYYHILNSLQLAFTRLSLNDLSFLDNDKHVAVKFIERLIVMGHHFDQGAGKLARYFVHAVELLLDRLANKEQVTAQTFMMAYQKIDEYFSGFNDKITANVNRLLAEIEDESRVAEADHFTLELIKGKTQGDEMPVFLLDFFENQLAPVLHKTITRFGTQSKQCQQLLTDMDTLTWSIVYPLCDEHYRQRFEADVTQAMKRLFQIFSEQETLDTYVKEFFIEAESLHAKKLQGQRVQYDVMISADIFADEEYEKDDPETWYQSSQDKIVDIDSLQEQSWYSLTLSNETVRCRLLMINRLIKALIFVNMSGELVLKISFDEVHQLAGKLQPLTEEDKIKYPHAKRALIRELNTKLDILKLEYKKFQQQKAKDAKEQKAQEERTRLAVKLQMEKDKHAQTIRRQREIREAKERAAEERRLEDLNAQQRFYIKGIYRKLAPGVTIAYKSESGHWKEATLTIISKTTQKHIFSDNRGNKVLEPSKDEVLELIETQRLKVIKSADNASEQLKSLVKQRREKLRQL